MEGRQRDAARRPRRLRRQVRVPARNLRRRSAYPQKQCAEGVRGAGRGRAHPLHAERRERRRRDDRARVLHVRRRRGTAAFSAGDACDYLETERGLVQLTLAEVRRAARSGRPSSRRWRRRGCAASARSRRCSRTPTASARAASGPRARLMRFGNEGAIQFKPIGFPGCALVTSDVHLRRRCGDIGAASLSENQLKTWLDTEAESTASPRRRRRGRRRRRN